MRLEYELTPGDWADFAEYCVHHAPTYQRSVRTGRVVGIAILLVCAGGAAAVTGSFFWLAAGVLLSAAWSWYLLPRSLVASARTYALRQQRLCLKGKHIMEALPEGLHAHCDVTDSLIRWPGVEAVIPEKHHIFVLLGEARGYAVPKARITEGDLDSFLKEVSRYRAPFAFPAHA